MDLTATHTVVLVEGDSDRVAIETLAFRLRRRLEGVAVVAVGGASKFGRHLKTYGPQGHDIALAGMYDLGEEDDVVRALDRAGMGSPQSRANIEALGFFVCVVDLEDELIRSLGPDRVLQVIESADERGVFRSFQNQPAWRGRTVEDQLHRFMGTFSGRKVRYGSLLVEALDLDRVPEPLEKLLDHVTG
jgi:hypothetical protein